jgi:hypothetical protein
MSDFREGAIIAGSRAVLLGQLYTLARKKYVAAAKMMSASDDLTAVLKPSRIKNALVLATFFDIAAEFYEEHISSHQAPLFFEPLGLDSLLVKDFDRAVHAIYWNWVAWWESETSLLLEDPYSVRAVCEAVAFEQGHRQAGALRFLRATAVYRYSARAVIIEDETWEQILVDRGLRPE